MTTILLKQADLQFPVLGFPEDGDVMPFHGIGLLAGKTGWMAEQSRHLGMEIVDSGERRWRVSGAVETEPVKKKWWQFGRDESQVRPEIELQPIESQAFAATRARVEAEAERLFDDGDRALARIREATTMAELSEASFEITLRAQGRRILGGDPGIAIRTTIDVARRATILFGVVSIAFLDVEAVKVVEWLDDHDLLSALSAWEVDFFQQRRSSPRRRSEAQWHVEQLIALLWALNLVDPDADLEAIISIVPPASNMSLDEFTAKAALRSDHELATMAEHYRNRWIEAHDSYASDGTDDSANSADSAYRRSMAIQWILNPDRLNWE